MSDMQATNANEKHLKPMPTKSKLTCSTPKNINCKKLRTNAALAATARKQNTLLRMERIHKLTCQTNNMISRRLNDSTKRTVTIRQFASKPNNLRALLQRLGRKSKDLQKH